MRNWDRLVDDYLEQYAARGVASETVDHVRGELDRWGCWMKKRRPRPKLQEVSAELVIGYVRSRTVYRSKATVSGVVSVLRGMGQFLTQQGVWSSNPLRWMRGPKLDPRGRIPRRIGEGAMKRLWEAAASSRQGYHRQLWVAAIGLLYGTGLRRGELQRLNLGDYCKEDQTLRIDGRKTGQERRVALPELSGRCLEAYLPLRHNHMEKLGVSGEAALLVDQWGGRLSSGAISRGIGRLATRCGLEHLTLHQFRHTCASDLLEGGVQLPQVQKVLGHQTITTTVRYLHIADPHRHQAVALHPLNEILGAGGAS